MACRGDVHVGESGFGVQAGAVCAPRCGGCASGLEHALAEAGLSECRGTILIVVDHMDDVDWSGLFHAMGPAGDTPRHPAALVGEGDRAFVDGYSHLWSATLRREGKAWPVTAPTVIIAATLLDDASLWPDDPSMGDAMLAYLYAVGTAADLGDGAEEIRAQVEGRAAQLRAWTGDYLTADAVGRSRMWQNGTGLGELILDQAALACFDLAPTLLRRALPHLTSARPWRRTSAAAAVGSLARNPSAAAQRPMRRRQLTSMAQAAGSAHERATIVVAIGDLGGDTRPWLTDPHEGVRGSAALASALAGNDAADRVLRELARSPRAFNDSFTDMAPPLQFQSKPLLDLLTSKLGHRTDEAGETAPDAPA